jgi:D-glucuronyl C5-epimerase C-terminus
MPTKDIRYYAHTIRLKMYGFFYALTYPFFFKKKLQLKKVLNTSIFNDIKSNKNISANIDFKIAPYLALEQAFPLFDNYAKQILFDKNGIAMCRNDVPISYYNPLICAQVGLIAYNNYLAEKEERYLEIAKRQFENLIAIKSDFKACWVWYYPIDYPKLSIRMPWYSGIAQGVILSFMIRMQSQGFDIKDNELSKIVNSMLIPVEEGGVYSQKPTPWIEEYPTVNSMKVLNGFIFSIIGLHEYYIRSRDLTVEVQLIALYQSLFENLHLYQTGKYIKYCKTKAVLSNIEYMPIYVGLFTHLYLLTGEIKLQQIAKTIDQSYDHAAFSRFYS